MLTIELEPELELSLNTMAEQAHIAPDELVKQFIRQCMNKKQSSGLLIDMVKDLPKIACFEGQEPLAIQKALRDEWN
jgi:hypothetical protein